MVTTTSHSASRQTPTSLSKHDFGSEDHLQSPTSLPTSDAFPVDEEERVPTPQPSGSKPEKPNPVSWASLPRKDQLAILTLARLSEPLTQTSLQAYMFYQLRSFSPSAPDSTISYQAGMLQAAFTGAQFCTAVFWGRMADSERVGRKNVILIGLLGTAIGALGFGFSGSFAVAFCWRALGGGKSFFLCSRDEKERVAYAQIRDSMSWSVTASCGSGHLSRGCLLAVIGLPGGYLVLFGSQWKRETDRGDARLDIWPYAVVLTTPSSCVLAAYCLLSHCCTN